MAIGKTLAGKDRAVCWNLPCLLEIFKLPGRAKRNVAHHYNLKDSLFDQFLDPRRQYSCGYFHNASDTLADAQITKLARLGAKLCLQPNQQFMDIGCGWAGLPMHYGKCSRIFQ